MSSDSPDSESNGLRERISKLETDAASDHDTIDELRAAVIADESTIAALEAEGVIDRQEITNLKTACCSQLDASAPRSAS